jgi:hypothetical protein
VRRLLRFPMGFRSRPGSMRIVEEEEEEEEDSRVVVGMVCRASK